VNSHSTEPTDIRRFGLVALVFFGALCGVGIWKGRPVPTYLFGGLCALGLGFTLIPSRLRPVYLGWLRVSHLVGRAVTLVILSVAYYLVITPAALIKRIVGGRPLPLKPDRRAGSYWVVRSEPMQPKERFLKRF
jgi:hypothetical protein